VNEKLIEHMIETGDLLHVYFQDEAVLSRDAMAFCNLWNCLRKFRDLVEVAGKGPNSDKGHHFIA